MQNKNQQQFLDCRLEKGYSSKGLCTADIYVPTVCSHYTAMKDTVWEPPDEKKKTTGDKLHQQQQQKSIEESQAGTVVSAARTYEYKKPRRLLIVEAK